ncbi:MAG: NAD-dependent epimerase/dehydratase family protein [Phycisphaerae bacterium]
MTKLNVGITGMAGFVGTHLKERFIRDENVSVAVPFEDDYFNQPEKLKEYLARCDVVVHLAAMNRGDDNEIYNTNVELVKKLVSTLEKLKKTPHILFSSSTQVELDNPYGRSKKEGAKILTEWAKRNNAPVTILTIPNVFGDRCRPFYNSVIATFCHLLTHGGSPEIKVDNELHLIYINELTEIIHNRIENPPRGVEEFKIPATAHAKVTEILAVLKRFREYYYDKKKVPYFANTFERNLYSTFITYMNPPDFCQVPTLHTDNRGMLFEIIKQEDGGQIFFSWTKPGIVRGNHYHTHKMEKFCVVQGQAIIRLRRVDSDKVEEYPVSGESPSFIEIPIFHTHNIENVGTVDLLTLFWASEVFNPDDPDTFFEQV